MSEHELIKKNEELAREVRQSLQEMNLTKTAIKTVENRLKFAEKLNLNKDLYIKDLMTEVSEVQFDNKENSVKLHEISLVIREESGIFGSRKS